MSTSIANGLLAGALIAIAVTGLAAILGAGPVQVEALRETASGWEMRRETLVSIRQVVLAPGSGDIVVFLDNAGSTTIEVGDEMDVFVYYVPEGQAAYTAKRLDYVAGTPGNDQWTLKDLVPDDIDPGLWGPGEQAELELHPWPWVESGTAVAVTVVLPNGILDTAGAVAP